MKVKFSLIRLLIPLIQQVLANIIWTEHISCHSHSLKTQMERFIRRYREALLTDYRGKIQALVKCAFNCFDEDDCTRFYMEDGACVFGLTSNAEGFEGEMVTPAASQIVTGKRKR